MALEPASLTDLALLRGLSPEVVGELAVHMSERYYAKREVVFNKREPGRFLCFLLEGRLQGVDFTTDGREVGLYFIEPGQDFGEVSIIDNGPRPDFVISVARSRVAFLPGDVARKLIINTPDIAESVLIRMAQRLRSTSEQRTLLGLPNPAQRICGQLAQMVALTPEGLEKIMNAPTHQELAIMVNTSRETVTRVFHTLLAHGVVSRESGNLTVDNPDYLRKVAEGIIEPPKPS